MSFAPSKKSPRRRAVRSKLATAFVGLESLESRVMLSATLQFTPSSGTVTTENGQEVVTVAPGTTINFTTALANGSDATKSFQLDFSNSDPALTLSSWTTNGAWATQTDSTLGVDDSVVSASNGSALTAPTLGTFTVTAPSTPGDYPLTANADTIFSGSLYYTLFINRVKEAIEEGPFPDFDGVQVTSVDVASVNGGRTTDPVATQDYQNIFKVNYTYDPVTQVFTTSTPQFIAQTLGADGIIQANNGADLVIGGQANQVFEVPSGGGTVQTANLPSGESFHLSLDPSGTSIWTSDEPGDVLSKVPLDGFGTNITTLNVTGDQVTQLGFASTLTAMGNYAYYTKSNRDGGAGDDGSWGIINLDTGVATPVQSNIDGPHSIVFDSYTGDMMMYGDHTITQVDISNPMSPTVVSTLDVSTQLNAVAVNLKFSGTATGTLFGVSETIPVTNFDTGVPLSVLDQGAVDGFGHAFIATNSGYAVVLDYANSNPADRLVGNATVAIDQDTNKLPFVAEYLDDFSPVVSPTSQGGTILTAADGTGIPIANIMDNVVIRVATPTLPTVTIAAPDDTASESGGDTGTITVTRTGATDAALVVPYSITGSATNGIDYSTITSSVTIPIGQLSADITITPIDRNIVGGSKTATLTLNTSSDYTIGDTSAATVTIADNDVAAVINATAQITAEQIDGGYHYTITLDNTGGTTIGTFWYAWSDTPADFMPVAPVTDSIVSPTGWVSQPFGGGPGNGYSIQWTSTSNKLNPGDSLSTFEFDSTATPAQIAADSVFYPGTPVNESFVYIGAPEADPGLMFNVTPEFVSAPIILGLAGADDTGSSNGDGVTSLNTGLHIIGTADPDTTINLFSGSTLIATANADDSGSWEADIQTVLADGNYTLTAKATDSDDHVSPVSNALSLTIDTASPSVESIARTDPAGPTTSASTVTYTVTFSDPVTGVDATDFNVVTTDTITASDPDVSGSGSVYTVTIGGISGSGTLGLNLVNDDTIQDIAGNSLIPPGTTTGPVYDISNAAPPDTTPPGDVTAFNGEAGDTQAVLSWTNPTDSDLAGVVVVRRAGLAPSGAPVTGTAYNVGDSLAGGTVVFAGAGIGFTDTGLTDGTQYFYTAYAFDTSNNYAAGAVTNATPVDTTAPANVTAFNAVAQDQEVDLSWANPTDGDLSGVVVVRRAGQAPSGAPIAGTTYHLGESLAGGTVAFAGSGTGFNDAGLTDGTQYFYEAFAFDTAKNYASGAAANATPAAPLPNLSVAISGVPALPTTLVPGDSVTLSGQVAFTGAIPANATIRVELFLLPDGQLPGVNDAALTTVSLKGSAFKATGLPVNWTGKITVPGTLDPGAVHYVAVVSGVVPGANHTVTPIQESNPDDNIATIGDNGVTTLVLELGTVAGHAKPVSKLTVDGITYAYSGPGSASIIKGADGQPDSVVITTDTSGKATLTATAGRGVVAQIQELTVHGYAKAATLKGFSIAGGVDGTDGLLGSLVVGNFADGHTITLHGVDGTNKAAFSLTAVDVDDLSIDSVIPIKSIAVSDWTDTGDTRDTIDAPSIGTITSKGGFNADVTVTDADPSLKASLASVSVKGILDSIIRSAGSIGSITAGRIVDSLILVATVDTDPELDGLPANDAAFVTGSTASAVKVTATGIRGDPGASFVASVVAAPNVGTVSLKDVATGGGPYGVAAEFLIKSVTRTGKPPVKNLKPGQPPVIDGDLFVEVV